MSGAESAAPSVGRSVLLFFVGTLALGLLWALATPVIGVPDEHDHVRRAAGLVRGQLLGAASIERAGRRVDLVRIPETLGRLEIPCFAFSGKPGCEREVVGRGDVSIEVESRLSRYNPAYYVVVGLPTLVEPGARTVLVMRAVTALLVAGLISLGVWSLLEAPRPARWAIVGLAAAITPMTLFFAGSVNPSAVEIAAGTGLWLALLAWFTAPPSTRDRAHAIRAATLAVALVSTRALAPLILALITTGAALASPRAAVGAIARRRPFKVAAGVVALATVGSIAWTLWAGTLEAPTESYPEYESARRFLFDVMLRLSDYERQMIGVFGWLDTPAQEHVYVAWFALLGFLVIGALAVGPTRTRLVLLLLGLASVALPIAIQYPVAADFGLIWQGRYLLPLMTGLPLVAGMALASSPGWNALFTGRWSLLVPLGLVGLAHLSSFWWALHRNIIGLGEPWIGFTAVWQPPLGWVALTALYVVAVAGWLAVLVRLAGGSDVDRSPRNRVAEPHAAGLHRPTAR